MTKIKFCGLKSENDIIAVNKIIPEYIGFVFAKKSKRYVSPETAAKLKKILNPKIKAVGVFVNEPCENVAKLLNEKVIDIAQLHGGETDGYILELKKLTEKPVIKAFGIKSSEDIAAANESKADFVLLDSVGGGTGKTFDWNLIKEIKRPYFLAGGFNAQNVTEAIELLKPFAVDVSSGIETDGIKDENKMIKFAKTVRNIG